MAQEKEFRIWSYFPTDIFCVLQLIEMWGRGGLLLVASVWLTVIIIYLSCLWGGRLCWGHILGWGEWVMISTPQTSKPPADQPGRVIRVEEKCSKIFHGFLRPRLRTGTPSSIKNSFGHRKSQSQPIFKSLENDSENSEKKL